MVNGRPETYREVAILSKAYKMAEYVQISGENIVEKICNFLLADPTNKVAATPDNLLFVNEADVTQELLHIDSMGKEYDYIEMTADRFHIRVPHQNSSGGGFGSSNNNNNNNNNNNS